MKKAYKGVMRRDAIEASYLLSFDVQVKLTTLPKTQQFRVWTQDVKLPECPPYPLVTKVNKVN